MEYTKKKKCILGKKVVTPDPEQRRTVQSSTIDAVRWGVPDLRQPYNSAPSRASDAHRGPQQRCRKGSLKELSSLQECVHFILHWKEQVDQVCKGCSDHQEGVGQQEGQRSNGRGQRSLEESRRLILQWAQELRHVHKDTSRAQDGQERDEEEEEEEDVREEAQTQIMDWAKELKIATESCGVQSDRLRRVVHLLSHKRNLLVTLEPLLEFITWSLLEESRTKTIPQLWLLVKQRTWKAGIPRYIPNSVWSWICSAAADVVLDPMTNNPWLLLSDDRRRVQEGHRPPDPPLGSQRFDSWPCVLGREGYDNGRRYWEVDIANNGSWRAGVTSADSKRRGYFPMTPRQNYWVLWRSAHHFYACSRPEAALPVGLAPRRLGVYLDHQEGQISFYNAETKSHIYTFTGTFRGKLHPLFAPMDGQTLMTVREQRKISLQ